MRSISRRKLITGSLAATAGVAGLAVAAKLGASFRIDSARFRGNLRPGRDA